MNERISQLIKQSYVTVQSPSGEGSTYFSQEKFAELIVKNVCNIVLHFTDVDEGVAVAKKHFGVEE